MFVNTMPRYEILSADAIGVLDRGWRRIVSEIGIQFAKPEAVELFAKAGQRVDGDVVDLASPVAALSPVNVIGSDACTTSVSSRAARSTAWVPFWLLIRGFSLLGCSTLWDTVLLCDRKTAVYYRSSSSPLTPPEG